MGTIGVMRCIGEDGAPAVYGFSTSDSPPAQFWHGLAGGPSRHAVLAYGLMPQQGINAGLNERGLLIVSSHFDFADPSDHPVIRGVGDCWLGDLRGLIQAEALAVCIDAWDALEAMRRGIAEGGPSIGGSHIIADRSGTIIVFEHCRGRAAWRDETAAGWAVRSNQAFGLFAEEQRLMPVRMREDRARRYETAAATLRLFAGRPADRRTAVDALKRLTASHERGGTGSGSICAHGILHGRSNAPLPHMTLSAMVWDVAGGAMHYTTGRPCESAWRIMAFA